MCEGCLENEIDRLAAKPTVGQRVWVCNYYCQLNPDGNTLTGTITRIGREFLYVRLDDIKKTLKFGATPWNRLPLSTSERASNEQCRIPEYHSVDFVVTVMYLDETACFAAQRLKKLVRLFNELRACPMLDVDVQRYLDALEHLQAGETPTGWTKGVGPNADLA